MAESIQFQIGKLNRSINSLEALRAVLGIVVVGPALATLKPQLSQFESRFLCRLSQLKNPESLLFSSSSWLAQPLLPKSWIPKSGSSHSWKLKFITG